LEAQLSHTKGHTSGKMGTLANMKIIGTFRDYANAPRNLSIFDQSVTPLQMLEVRIFTSNSKYCEDKIDNIKTDLTLGMSGSMLRGNGIK
jgi:hypothetical protein